MRKLRKRACWAWNAKAPAGPSGRERAGSTPIIVLWRPVRGIPCAMWVRSTRRKTPCTRSGIGFRPTSLTSTFSFCRNWKATSGFFRAPVTCRLGFAAKASRRSACERGWNATWTSGEFPAKKRSFTDTCSPR